MSGVNILESCLEKNEKLKTVAEEGQKIFALWCKNAKRKFSLQKLSNSVAEYHRILAEVIHIFNAKMEQFRPSGVVGDKI